MGLSVFWFKRDLRVEDNPALAAAAARGPVVPVYVIEPEYWAQAEASERQFGFLLETLGALDEALKALGCGLVVRVGDAVDALAGVVREIGAGAIYASEETGTSWTFRRDLKVAEWARGAGIGLHAVAQSGVVRRLPRRDGWAKARDAFVFGEQVEAPGFSPFRLPASDDMPTAARLGLQVDGGRSRQVGGRPMALSLLGGFLTERGRTYRADMSTPVAGETACSRMSPHLALGAVSIREVAQAAAARQREVRGTREGWGGSLKSFQSRLAWRDHFMQKLEDEPALDQRCLHSAYETLRPRVPDAARLAAWEAGETGLPFVDACMRYLNATGWLNFRMRSMLVAVASYHLWLDWRVTGKHLARMFTDYEPGIHWSQMQMQAGVTGMNTVRIYNPIKQGHDQDPDGVFTRRWVPELAGVPDAHLQTPWTWEGAGGVLGRAYPEPIVDVAEAARVARERVWAVRRGPAFREEAARVIKKHASRKDRAGRFVNDRVRQAKKRDTRQIELDL